MRTITLGGLFFFAALVTAPICAQIPSTPPRRLPQQQMHDEDGGIRETLESIVITPMAHSPFTATLETEWVRTLSTGGTITLVNQRRLARDGSGRVYQERWLLVPKSGKQESQMSAIQISDPCGSMTGSTA